MAYVNKRKIVISAIDDKGVNHIKRRNYGSAVYGASLVPRSLFGPDRSKQTLAQ